MNKTIAYISARGGSKSIPYKNIKTFNGKPLVLWCIEAALGSKYIDEVMLATDTKRIFDVISVYIDDDRMFYSLVEDIPDDALQEETLIPFAEKEDFSHVILLQATTPYTTAQDIDEAFKKYFNGKYDSLISVCRQHRFIWGINKDGTAYPVNYDYLNRTRRQDWGGFLIENGAFFITSREALLKSKNRISGKIGVYEMSAESYFEIDDEADWIIAEQLMKRRQSNDVAK